jgi:hypothetical protein
LRSSPGHYRCGDAEAQSASATAIGGDLPHRSGGTELRHRDRDGKKPGSFAALARLAAALGVSLDDIAARRSMPG